MKKTAKLGICIAGALVGVTTAGLPLTGASAADWIRPSKAPLVDASSNDSGCDAGSPALGIRQNAAGEYLITKGTNMVCDQVYAKYTVKTGLWEVLSDGTRVVVDPFTEVGRGGLPAPGTLIATRGGHSCADFPGTHTFFTRSTWKVKETKDSTNPYTATVERISTVTCPA